MLRVIGAVESGRQRFPPAGRRFRLGVLLYDGVGEHLFAVPVGALWS